MDEKHTNWLLAIQTFAEIHNITIKNCPESDPPVIVIKEEPEETPAMPSLTPHTPRGRKRIFTAVDCNIEEDSSDEDFDPDKALASTSTPQHPTRSLWKRPLLKDSKNNTDDDDSEDDEPLDDSHKDSDLDSQAVDISNEESDDETNPNQSRRSLDEMIGKTHTPTTQEIRGILQDKKIIEQVKFL